MDSFEIVKCIREGWKSRRQICAELNIPVARAVRHIRHLQRDGYIEAARTKAEWSNDAVPVYHSTGKMESDAPNKLIIGGIPFRRIQL